MDRSDALEAARKDAESCFDVGHQSAGADAILYRGADADLGAIIDALLRFNGDMERKINACAIYAVEVQLSRRGEEVSSRLVQEWDRDDIDPLEMLERLR